ncbi:BC1881 family protein [Cytobacillus solani]|uniref:Uncharacterized protein n=1 Tax=Cytobacillus solani TaxID=1637975 RepID=A0A0Q3VGS9_9BACI|nr:BC1881 family protein [Cytobacillus solani]KQL18843.1 hypothetical protein AN957_09860 [Cytobacillus solani]
MADNQSRELSIAVKVDVSEALTGLKAIQREAKKATQALRELEAAHSTKSLHEALVQREGVEEYFVNAHGGSAKISIDNGAEGSNFTVEGPARIVVNRD